MRFCCCCCCFSDLLQVRSCSLQLPLQERQHWADLEVGEDLSPSSWKGPPLPVLWPRLPLWERLAALSAKAGSQLWENKTWREPRSQWTKSQLCLIFSWKSVQGLYFSLNMKQLLCFTRPWKQTLITRHSVGCPHPLVHLVKGSCNIWCGPTNTRKLKVSDISLKKVMRLGKFQCPLGLPIQMHEMLK